MTRRTDIFDYLGLARLPWVARVYMVLVFTFTGLLLLSTLPIFTAPLAPIAVDGLKMVLAALLGALSQAGERRFPPAPGARDPDEGVSA